MGYKTHIIIFLFKVTGSIELRDNGDNGTKSWPVYADCQYIRIISAVLKISYKEYLKIDETQYAGMVEIDTIVSSNFTVTFQSYETEKNTGSILNWACINWGNWSPTGTCTEVNSLQPEYKGPDIKYRTKYRKTNETCSK